MARKRIHVLLTDKVIGADGIAFCGLRLDGSHDWFGGTGGATCKDCVLGYIAHYNNLVRHAVQDLMDLERK